jgi:hypothetical protein
MNKALLEEFRIFCGKDIGPDDWLWCRKCHRCYKASEFRYLTDEGEIFLRCHYKNCHGDLPLDSRPWNKLVKDKPKLSATPTKGTVYDL